MFMLIYYGLIASAGLLRIFPSTDVTPIENSIETERLAMKTIE